MPATHAGGYDAPYGSHPGIDETVEYGDVNVSHDGYDRSRHDKLEAIAAAAPDQLLFVCRSGAARGEGNCSRCEKCLRTIAAMVSLGIDPERHGLMLNEQSVEYLGRLVRSRVLGSSDTPFFWRGVVDRSRAVPLPEPDKGAARALAIAVRGLQVDSMWSGGSAPMRRRVRQAIGRVLPHRLRPLARRIYLRLFGHW